jgi:redox-sensitive bicupin YhaK (pirin superfamily)
LTISVPATERPQDNHDVRPHPHIGLATVTYLFEGAMMHRDSLGVVQQIEPGAINWMTAGRGIVHSERKPEGLRDQHFCEPRPAAVGGSAART